jgi:DNA replication protein DnaC
LQSVAFTPGTGKTHLAIGLAIKAAQAGHRIAFATAVDWVARLKAAHNACRLPGELAKLRRIGLLVVDLSRPRDYADSSAV